MVYRRVLLAGTKEESRRLTKNSSRGNTVNRNAPDFARISAHAPTEGPISQDDYLDRLEYSPTQNVRCGGFSLEFAYVTQRGFYPGSPPDKPNQDAVYVKSKFGDNPNHHFFAVFDGHGGHGEDISRFAKYKVTCLSPFHSLLWVAYSEAWNPIAAYTVTTFMYGVWLEPSQTYYLEPWLNSFRHSERF